MVRDNQEEMDNSERSRKIGGPKRRTKTLTTRKSLAGTRFEENEFNLKLFMIQRRLN